MSMFNGNTLAPTTPAPQRPQHEDPYDYWVQIFTQAYNDNPSYFERVKADIAAKAKARNARLLIDFHFDRKKWIREHPGQDNSTLWVEYDRKTGKLVPIEQALHFP